MNFEQIGMTEKERKKFSLFIEGTLGIRMPVNKKTLMETRLSKRLTECKLTNFSAYYDFLTSPAGMAAELPAFINAITTNKTDFFREPAHFEFLLDALMPRLAEQPVLQFWSAGCSTGEEPYSLAMILEDYRERSGRDYSYLVYASDISTRVLSHAFQAEYTDVVVEPVPPLFKGRYLQRHKTNRRLYRVKPALRRNVVFRCINFLEPFEIKYKFDVIFCRNVFIYFDKENQQRALANLLPYLKADGYLFIGHSESILSLPDVFRPIAPSVYRFVR